MHTFNPRTQVDFCKFKAILVYTESARPGQAILLYTESQVSQGSVLRPCLKTATAKATVLCLLHLDKTEAEMKSLKPPCTLTVAS